MRCPNCGGQFDARDAMMDAEWGDIFYLLPSFGGHGRLVFEYVEKFGVNPLRIKSKKILRLLTEMSWLFNAGEFIYRKRRHIISRPVAIEAMRIVNNKHFAEPLENHNYLKKVMISLAAEEAKEASKRGERELREKEEQLKYSGREQTEEVGEFMSGPEYLKSIGKTSLRGGE